MIVTLSSCDDLLSGIVSGLSKDIEENHTSIVASYVKFVESAGGRVVPIMYPIGWVW